MAKTLQPDRWYLFQVKSLKLFAGSKAKTVNALFVCLTDEFRGIELIDTFYLTEKAVSRFEVLAHRCGVEVEVKSPDVITPELLQQITNRKVWARIVEDQKRPNVLKTDGWNFRDETDPPEDELFVDYKAQDEDERMLEGL